MTPSQVIVFDVETTGTDRRRDQVIELCIQFGLEDRAQSRTWRIRPSVSISPGAQAVHGITMNDLRDCPPFRHFASEVRQVFDSARVLVGYNLEFDIGMLQAEFHRLRQPLLELRHKNIIDAFRLWQRCEPRSLQHAHQRFVGDSFAQAHSATADVAATGRVLRNMIKAFGLADHDWGSLAGVCEPDRPRWIGPSRHVRWADDGRPALGFGRHAGALVDVLAHSEERSYLRWIVDSDFPPHVRDICLQALALPASDFVHWVRRHYGPAPGAIPKPVTASVKPAVTASVTAPATASATPSAQCHTATCARR